MEGMAVIGRTISHYKILEKLGSGGMGVVYKAQDFKLDRFVALKFLPSHISMDEDEKERFIHEAKTASALDHTNICTIHEIDETEAGQMFIVMAHYEGETLKDKIKRGLIPLEESQNITSQIARGLEKAHKKGIIHRDIKPANIFLTQDGVVKILDFGLAKLGTQTKLTKKGTTLGTVAYMSPQQARGEEVDHRTDIWSLGVVLYEMLTGKLPFKGEYEQAVIYSILNEKPEAVTALRTDVSKEMEKILNKALAKNPNERYQNTNEILSDLKDLKKVPSRRQKEKKRSISVSKPLKSILVVFLLSVILSIGYFLIRPSENKDIQIIHTSPLTTAPGLEQDPSWSPEGTRIAYASDESGNMDVWVRQIAAGQKLNLTKDYPGYDGKPAWSPDGEWVAFVSNRDGGGVFMIPALGGIPKRVVSISFTASLSFIGAIPPVCWSPDGAELAYASAGILYTVSAHGGTPSSIPLPPSGLVVGFSEPAWSPDGERIVCTGFVATGVATSQIWSVRNDGTDPIPITRGKYYDLNPIWSSDGRQLFFISDRGGNKDVWWVSINARGKLIGFPRSLTTGAGVGAIALSRDGTKLAYSKVMERSNIWSIPIVRDRTFKLDEAEPLTSENHYIENLAISPDSEWIAFDSNRSGNMDIWIMRKDGSGLRQLTTNPAHDWVPHWSPDGKQIAFHSLRHGNRDLYVMPVAGGAIKPLTTHPAEDFAPVWSPDGETIAFDSNRSGNMDIWLIPSEGGEPRQVTFHEARDFSLLWSPDGKRLVFSTDRTGYNELFFIPLEGGDPVQLTHGAWSEIYPLFWSVEKQTIYAYGQGGPGKEGVNLWAVLVADGTAKPLLDFQDSIKEPSLSLSSDGKRIYFPLIERMGDLWLAELETNKK
jgi:Tol biopolymer transport system component